MKRFFNRAWPLSILVLSAISTTFFPWAAADVELSPKESCSWFEATNNAPWQARCGQGTAVFHGKLWVIGGKGGDSTCFNDVWYSPDGSNWTRAVEHAEWVPRAWHSVLVFSERLWVFGGKTATDNRLNDVWYSQDGCSWTQATGDAPWAKRYAHGAAVFHGKLWILGGYYGHNDVWCSEDGVSWHPATVEAPWPVRAWSSAAAYENKLWIVGGYSFERYPREYNDVWCTEDGAYWVQVTEDTAWCARAAHSALAFDDRLWLLGGEYTEGIGSHYERMVPLNDVWSSADGLTWSQADAPPWCARSGHASACFQDKLWVLGGDAWGVGLQNDVWYGELDHSAAFSGTPVSGGAPLVVQFTDESTAAGITVWNWDFGDGGTSEEQHPSHEYTVRGVYTVSLTVTAESGAHTETRQDYITTYGEPHPFHSADTNQDNVFNLSELMRIIQFFNSGGFHCAADTEDGFAPAPGDDACALHDADYAPPDWQISLSELLRVIQLYNSRGYQSCTDGEDGFCPGAG